MDTLVPNDISISQLHILYKDTSDWAKKFSFFYVLKVEVDAYFALFVLSAQSNKG